jgi:DNA-binding MarR family transcriptional regulator
MNSNEDPTLKFRNTVIRSITKVNTASRLYLFDRFSKSGIDITPDMYLVLRCLWENDRQTQQQLADEIYKGKASLTKLITNLESRGLIQRKTHNTDRRNKLVYLTAEGKKLKRKVFPIAMDLIEQAESEFSDKEIKLLQAMLDKIYQKLKR